MIKFCFSIYLLVLAFGACSAIFKFLFDVIKWHKKEEKIKIIPSAYESEVNEIERGEFRGVPGGYNDNSDRNSDGRNNNDNNGNNDNSGNFF